jgi:rsbT co-antagonist protein RsbR
MGRSGTVAGDSDHRTVAETDYQRMVNAILDAEIIMLDNRGDVLTWNEGARRLKGYTADEVLGRNISMFYVDGDAELARAELDEAARSGRFEGEGWRKRKSGDPFWANVVIQPMYGGNNEVTGFVKVTRDLSERQRQQSELRLAAMMLDSITDYEVIFLDVDGIIRTWARGAELVTGYTAAEAIGHNVSIFYLDEDVESGLAVRERAQALQLGRFETEGWRTRKGGARFWANVTLAPVRDTDGEHVGFVKVTRDLTERVERERLVKRQRDEILELSTPVIQIWDRVLALPIIGTLDSNRAARATESLLQRIADDEAAIVILDISGVPMIDTLVAQHLFKTIQGARLMGAESVISGVRPETAQAMVHLGIDMGGVRSRSTLRDALQLAFSLLAERNASTAHALDAAPTPRV